MPRADPVHDIGHDPDALEVFYRSHLPEVRRYVARRVTDPADAADLTADVFIAAIEHAHRYRADAGSPMAWLIGIARHVVAGHYRAAGRRHRATSRIVGRNLLDDDASARIAARIDAEQPARALLTELAALPEAQRAVVELVAVDGLPLTEAAAVLGISPGAARVRYHRARRRLDATIASPLEVAR